MGTYVKIDSPFCKELYVRGPMKIEDLKECSRRGDGVIRYDFHEMKSLVELRMKSDYRGCIKYMRHHGIIPPKETRNQEDPYLDFWHWQLENVFRTEVRNDSVNTLYIGTDPKKFKEGKGAKEWQMHIQEIWYDMFKHLADKHDKIKVEVWW